MNPSCEIVLRWIPHDEIIDDKSTSQIAKSLASTSIRHRQWGALMMYLLIASTSCRSNSRYANDLRCTVMLAWRNCYDVTMYFQFSYGAFLLYYSFTLLTNFSEESTYHEYILSIWVFTLFCDEIRQVCRLLLGLFNSTTSGRLEWNFRSLILKLTFVMAWL